MTLGPWYVGDSPTTNLEIHVQRDGVDIPLDGYVSAEVLLFNSIGEAIVWGTTPTIDGVNDVINVTPPSSSPFASAGIYAMYLRLTASGGGTETFFATDIRVLALGGSSAWTTTSKIRSITGSTVTEDDLAMAQGVIELYSGRTYAGSQANASIRPKDLGWLEKAVAYQAIWQLSQPGYLTRHAIKEVNQDGAQIIYAGSSEPNNTALIMLAPLANRALKNVSWLRSRTIRVKAPSLGGSQESYGDYKRNDDHPGWRAM